MNKQELMDVLFESTEYEAVRDAALEHASRNVAGPDGVDAWALGWVISLLVQEREELRAARRKLAGIINVPKVPAIDRNDLAAVRDAINAILGD
jgi:hypothetical protein